ncbi:MAG: peptide-methionine (S)-S-oxide reductase MsrA [Burkholderiales bacterium]|nr:peptide-methionine (S)-S-oxide reductase MsrA [Burkholderiales bacterium]
MKTLFALLALVAAAFGAAAGAQPVTAVPPGMAVATFAGGCFWCMEPPYDKIPGVVSTTSGYIGGKKKFPTYEEVSAGITGHTEAVRVIYDPKRVTYRQLLEVFWKNIDPIVKDRQFCDGGTQYRSGVYWHDDEQKKLIEESKALLNRGQAFGSAKPVGFKGGVVTETGPAAEFWAAEDYHQDYYKKNPIRYNYYATGCGRAQRLKELWGEAK